MGFPLFVMSWYQPAWKSQFTGVNTVKGERDAKENVEGPVGQPMEELELSLPDDELIQLKKAWELKWTDSDSKKTWEKKGETNEKYWAGTQDKDKGERPLQDNVIFESTETLLPVAGRQNPEPVATADNSEEGMALAGTVKKQLVFQADRLKLKMIGKQSLRSWMIYLLGIAKVGWDMTKNDIDLFSVRPQRIILDPDAMIDNGVYYGAYIGEICRDSAKNLLLRFPNKKAIINKASNDKDGTELAYGEWWTNDYVFWTLGDDVLKKAKNPHWNYDGEEMRTDAYGNQQMEMVQGRNHFPAPRMPYTFLSVFNLGKHPFDETSLIEQNTWKQDLINKRLRQIDRNADGTNGGLILSGQAFTSEQAAQAANALCKGVAIVVPNGDVNAAVRRDQAPPLPSFVYEQLVDTRNAVRTSFGVSGLSPQGIKSESTVRGKIIVQGQDQERTTLIIDYLEQFYDEIFNWWTQLFYVYYDEPHMAAIVGNNAVQEFNYLRSSDLNRKLLISVKEGSLIPQDDLTKANQAVDLWSANALDPVTFYSRLGFADPKETAKQLFLWQTNPMAYFGMAQPQPEGATAQQMGAAPDAMPTAPTAPEQSSESLLSAVPIQ